MDTLILLYLWEERQTKIDMGKFKSLNTLGEMDGKKGLLSLFTGLRRLSHEQLGV